IRDLAGIQHELEAVDQGADLTALVVGDATGPHETSLNWQALYPEGTMRFDCGPLRFDLRTPGILLAASIKTILMPLKNILLGKGRRWETAKLLFERRRIVFCGSYGTTREAIAELCARSSVDLLLFDGYEYFSDTARTFGACQALLRSNG